MAENLYGDTAFPDYSKNINDFFNRFGRAFGRASQQAQAAQVNPYGGTMRGTASTPPVRKSARELGLTDTGEGGAYAAASQQMPLTPSATPAPRRVGGGAPANPIDALFAPMFENLRKQRQQANKRYEANTQQVTNIYGQITGARSADIAATETAFKRLVDAAAARSTAVNAGIDAAEAQRLQQNQAALQSMGLEGLSTPQGDIAAQTAAQAQQTNALNAANWQNMLSAMGATAGQQARADVAGYNYAMLEDLGRLRGAREEFAQELGQQRGELKAQKAKATFEYQQAQQRAAAAAKEAKRQAKFAENKALAEQQAEALKGSGPVITTVDSRIKSGLLDSTSGSRVIDTISEWFINVPAPTVGRWNAGSATASLLSTAGPSLSGPERAAIIEIFNKMKW